MSTSKPVISPVIGSRKLNRLLPMSSPTISLPRARMSATAASASALVAKGRRLAVGSQSWLELSGGSGGCGGMISMPTGVGSGSVGVASTPSVSEWPQLASTIAKASGASGLPPAPGGPGASSPILFQPGPQAERDGNGGT